VAVESLFYQHDFQENVKFLTCIFSEIVVLYLLSFNDFDVKEGINGAVFYRNQ
jgi:hypothetical protein